MEDVFKTMGGVFMPDSLRKEAAHLSGRVERNQIVVDIHPLYKVGYSSQLNCIRVLRDGEVIRTEVVPEGYTVSQFQADCFRFHCIFNNLANG